MHMYTRIYIQKSTNSPEVKITQTSFSVEGIVVYLYHRIVFSNENELLLHTTQRSLKYISFVKLKNKSVLPHVNTGGKTMKKYKELTSTEVESGFT